MGKRLPAYGGHTVSPLRSLQAKLVVAFVFVVILGLAVASVLFVALRRDDQERRELDRVAAAGPAVFSQFAIANSGRIPVDLSLFVQEISKQYSVRVLLVTVGGEVALDSSHRLEGSMIEPPGEQHGPWRAEGPYLRYDPPAGSPAHGLTLVTSSLPRLRGGDLFPNGRPAGAGRPRPGGEQNNGTLAPPGNSPQSSLPGGPATTATTPTGAESYSLVLGVSESSVANAWLDLLPGLLTAAAIALVVAIGDRKSVV